MKQVIKYAALIFAFVLSTSIIGGCLTAGVMLVRTITERTGNSEQENGDGVSWYRDEDGTLVFHWGNKSIASSSGEVKSGTEQFTGSNITSMDIDVVSCALIVEAWDNDYVSVDYENIPVEYKIYVEDETLKIEVTDGINFIWNNFTEKQEIHVFAPASVTYEKLDVEKTSGSGKIIGLNVIDFNVDTTSGGVDISDVTAKELYVDSVSGGVNISGSYAEKSELGSTSGSFTVQNCELGDTSMDGVSGSINFENVSAKNLVLDTTSGRVNFSGTLTGNSVFESVSGAISVVLNGKEEDYNLRVDMGSGNFYLNGKKEEDNHIDYDGADNLLVFDAGSGRVSVDFQVPTEEGNGAEGNYER